MKENTRDRIRAVNRLESLSRIIKINTKLFFLILQTLFFLWLHHFYCSFFFKNVRLISIMCFKVISGGVYEYEIFN